MIPGIPEGYRLVRIGKPRVGEEFINVHGHIASYDFESTATYIFPIIEKIPTPPLQLEVDGIYRRKDGKITAPLQFIGAPDFPFLDSKYKCTYDLNGKWCDEDNHHKDLVELLPPPEKQYRPFTTLEEWWPHRDRWVKGKYTEQIVRVHYSNEEDIRIRFNTFKFIDLIDGQFVETPFGVLD